MRLAALRTGGLLKQANLARDALVSRTTAQRWLSILEASFLVTLLPPFGESRAKRLIKTPKLYALDTGLALHLAGVEDADVCELHHGSGGRGWAAGRSGLRGSIPRDADQARRGRIHRIPS